MLDKIKKLNEISNYLINGMNFESATEFFSDNSEDVGSIREIIADILNPTSENLILEENQTEELPLDFESVEWWKSVRNIFNTVRTSSVSSSALMKVNVMSSAIKYIGYNSDLVKVLDFTPNSIDDDVLGYVEVYTKTSQRRVRRKVVLYKHHFSSSLSGSSYDHLNYSVEPRINSAYWNAVVESVVNKLFVNGVLTVDVESFQRIVKREIQRIDDRIRELNRELNDSADSSSNNVNFNNANSNGNFAFNPTDGLRSYTHRTVNVPIRGDVIGVEVEYYGDCTPISNFGVEFTYLENNGWVRERDASVTFEFKAPIMTLDELRKDFAKCKNLFVAWGASTDPDKAGLHVHVAMDDMFSAGKKPASKTWIFLTRFVQELETQMFPTPEIRKKVFKRNFTRYTISALNSSNLNNDRVYWVNLTNLNREAGKTIEIRMGSASYAGELNIYVEKAYMLVKLIKIALTDWRSKETPAYMNWKETFGETKMLKALLPKDILQRFVELFKQK